MIWMVKAKMEQLRDGVLAGKESLDANISATQFE